jgi:glycosyltransferase involved in cell wall biosynthesis
VQTFAIITTSKGRLEHLKLSLPAMMAQGCREVIVVDYSCPDGTADYVRSNFPGARVVCVEGEEHFSNWKARNAGAKIAQSDVLVFCDADTVLADTAIEQLRQTLPLKAFGCFNRSASASFNKTGLRLATNQLKGFQVIPTAAFRRAGGYDDVLRGYAAGGDTDLEDRLCLLGLKRVPLMPTLVSSVVEHDNSDRTRHHVDTISASYAAGLIYRSAKLALLRLRGQVELPLQTRERIYAAARDAAAALSDQPTTGVTVGVDLQPILMPRQLGYEKGVQRLSIKVDLSLENKIDSIPD